MPNRVSAASERAHSMSSAIADPKPGIGSKRSMDCSVTVAGDLHSLCSGKQGPPLFIAAAKSSPDIAHNSQYTALPSDFTDSSTCKPAMQAALSATFPA